MDIRKDIASRFSQRKLDSRQALVCILEMYKRLYGILDAYFSTSSMPDERLSSSYALLYEMIEYIVSREDLQKLKSHYFPLFPMLPGGTREGREEWDIAKDGAYDYIALLEKEILLSGIKQKVTPSDVQPIFDQVDKVVSETWDRFRQSEQSLAKYKNRISLDTANITFLDPQGQIKINDHVVQLPLHKNEHCLARVMFKNKIGANISWDVIYEELSGDRDSSKTKWRQVYDTVKRINKTIARQVPLDHNLFAWKSKHVRIDR